MQNIGQQIRRYLRNRVREWILSDNERDLLNRSQVLKMDVNENKKRSKAVYHVLENANYLPFEDVEKRDVDVMMVGMESEVKIAYLNDLVIYGDNSIVTGVRKVDLDEDIQRSG